MKEGRKYFFFEKKKQKTFTSKVFCAQRFARRGAKVFWFFFSKKNCFLLFLAGCAQNSGSGTCNLVHVTDLKLTQRGHAFFTTITINGQNAEFLLDTGSTINLMRESSARRLGLVITGAQGTVNGLGGEREIGEVRAREVRMGAAHGKDLSFATLRDDALPGTSDGLLSMDFLYGFDLDLDFVAQRAGLYRGLGDCSRPSVAMKDPLYGVPISDTRGNMSGVAELPERELSPVVDVSINGTRLRAMIDSGAGRTALYRDSARRVGVVQAELLARGMMHGVGPRAVKSDLRISAPVEIGDLTLSNLPVEIVDQRHDHDVDMLLGFDFLTRVHVWVSRSSNTVVMQYPPQATPLQ